MTFLADATLMPSINLKSDIVGVQTRSKITQVSDEIPLEDDTTLESIPLNNHKYENMH